MDYASAFSQVVAGKKAARSGWNLPGMYVLRITSWNAIVDGELAMGKPFLAIKTADGGLYPWAPTQADALAADWIILEEKTEVRVG